MDIVIKEELLIKAAQDGYDSFVNVVAQTIKDSLGGELTAEALQSLNADQITLWGFTLLHEEVMDGGFVQLIHNGYGPFFFDNPFAKAMRLWGLKELSKLIYSVRELYEKYGEDIIKERDEEEFMAMFEQYPQFDDLDDKFIEHEESYVCAVAEYIDQHIERFVRVQK